MTLELPVCEDCGAVQYPIREICVACLSERLQRRPVPAGGVLVSRTRLHHSMDARIAPRLPLEIGSVKLDAGPVAIALLEEGCELGRRVRLRFTAGPDRRTLVVAAPDS